MVVYHVQEEHYDGHHEQCTINQTMNPELLLSQSV